MEISESRETDRATPQCDPEYQEFTRLTRRYRRLGWPTTAAEQREHDRLNKELMRLYLRLHPNSPYRAWDDFDAVTRGKRNPAA